MHLILIAAVRTHRLHQGEMLNTSQARRMSLPIPVFKLIFVMVMKNVVEPFTDDFKIVFGDVLSTVLIRLGQKRYKLKVHPECIIEH